MRKPVIALMSSIAVAVSLTACTPSIAPTAKDEAPNTTEEIERHESAPASPIAFGISVPHGAVQLGPLVRWRSAELIKTYRVDLAAIEAEEEAVRLREIEEKQAEDPEWVPPTPTPSTNSGGTSRRDTFSKLEDTPRADTYVSLMRITGKPTLVVRTVLAQLSVLLPDAEIVTDDLSEYCTARNRRVINCELSLTGETPSGRNLKVHLTVDPGDVTERTGRAASRERPVMALYIQEIGDPRESQANRTPERLSSPPDVSLTAEKTDWIWPRMDESASSNGPVIGGWAPPASATILLTGKVPEFATMTTYRTSIANEISQRFVASQLTQVEPVIDTVADLNETLESTYGTNPKGEQVRSVRIASARGNFVSLFILPKGW
ncbi:MAG: hypothetical protein GX678_00545 [Actinomycetales bacterium]|nr:hypothetical protein [Actinomycetales bacterium]